jgi:magnesium-transporting ATPase (P-type)
VMITGDNTLTGSNISYKCSISNKSMGMIICDYVEGEFTEEDFHYQEEED